MSTRQQPGRAERWRRAAAPALAASLALLAASCTIPLRMPAARVPLPQAFSASGTVTPPAKWWQAFGDARLDALMERALGGNLDLRTAWDRLAQAEAVARRAGADLRPTLTGEAEASRTWTKVAGEDVVAANSYTLQLAAAYEVDLWRRVRATRDSAALAARASREDVDATALLLTAQVATTWYRLLDQLGQLALLDEQLRTNQSYLDLVTFRWEQGKVKRVDVLQQQQLVESTRADKHQAESDRRVLEHQLAVLLGESPGAPMDTADARLPDLPPLPQTGAPAELLQRRPDVRAAHLQLEAASRDVAAAVADRFPRLSLTASAETTSAHVHDLFDNWVANIASNLTAPLLDGGRRAAEVDRTRAVAAERLHSYGQTVLDAVREVEDALVQERQQVQFLASQEQQLDLASKAAEQTREYYATGVEDYTYLRVLTALQTLQRLQRDRLTAKRQLVEFRIALHQALGGAWGLVRPAAPTAAAAPGAGK